VTVSLVFETHSVSEDNEAGVATGWLPGRLSERGRELARELGRRRRHDDLAAVFSSDLARATETATLAFDGVVPVLYDWRLRECDYGRWNGSPRDQVHGDRHRYLDEPYPCGESWREAVSRVAGFLDDLPTRWADRRVLVVGHVATRWAFDHVRRGVPLGRLVVEDFQWQEGWEYEAS
jgi:broad specificity phosphatase PhoE